MQKLKQINIKECLLFSFFFFLVTALFLLVFPSVSFAISGTDTIYDHRISNFWELISNANYLVPSLFGGLCLDFTISLTDLANEFFGTITGSSLFTLGIEDGKFSDVMRFVGEVCTKLLPLGYTVLGIFAGIEALRITKDTKQLSSQWYGLGIMEAWLVFAIKFTILYTLITNAKALMLAIYKLVGNVQIGIKAAIDSSNLGDPSNTFSAISDMAKTITYDQAGIVILLVLVALLALVCAAGTAIYIQVLGVMRLFEIFILIAVSPVPVSGLVSSYTSSITAGYFKTFVGAVLQLSILFLIIALAGPVLGTITASINDVFAAGENPTIIQTLMASVTPIVTSISVFMMAKQSRPIADRLAGAA